jgi:hypothetical protein
MVGEGMGVGVLAGRLEAPGVAEGDWAVEQATTHATRSAAAADRTTRGAEEPDGRDRERWDAFVMARETVRAGDRFRVGTRVFAAIFVIASRCEHAHRDPARAGHRFRAA